MAKRTSLSLRLSRSVSSFAVLALFLLLTGCNTDTSTSQTKQKPEPSPYADWQAEQVLKHMQTAYANARSYSDKAVLYLTYRMHGKPIQEPQPWAFHIDRTKAKFSAQLFDTQTIFDGRDLGCRVFDIETENLDNQYLFLSAVTHPFNTLMADKIGRHFVGGFSDLPLRDDSASIVRYATPPTIQLLTGEAPFPWLSRPERGIRLEDQTVEGIVCFHIQTKIGEEVCDFWIEQETGLLHQLLLPNTLLEPKVTNSNQIEDLKFVARFHDCKFNGTIDEGALVIAPPASASLVKEFVKLPEAFPSELIGRVPPKFVLNKPTGEPVTRNTFAKKTTALLWIAGFAMEDGIKKLDEIREQFGDQINFGIVYSDAELKNPNGPKFEMTNQMKRLIQNLRVNVPFYCDKHLNTSSQLRIKAIPSVLVLDPNSKIQFARALSESDWNDELTVALKRIQNGDDLAEEMIAEYGSFYSQYRAKLLSLRADAPDGVVAQTASTFLSSRDKAETIWTADSTLRPGNMVATDNTGSSVAVLDGYQTLVVLDKNGRETVRKELQLPEGQGVNRIRSTNRNGKLIYAAFTKMGEQVHWFDEQLRRLGSWPKSPGAKITDCRFYDSNDGSKKLLVAVQGKGISSINIDSGQSATVTKQDANELAVSPTAYVGLTGTQSRTDQAELFKSDLPNFDARSLDAWNFTRIFQGGSGENVYCATGLSVDGQMQAIGLSEKFAIQWKVDVGIQNFQNDIEPIVYDKNHDCWIVADSEYGMQIISNSGELLFSMRIDEELQGITTASTPQQMRVVFATGREIKCVEVKLK